MKVLKPYHFLCLLFVATAGLFHGCAEQEYNNPDHPGILDTAMSKFWNSMNDSSRYFTVLDSGYHLISKPGTGDIWDRYHYCFDFFYFKKINYKIALAYADSMLLTIDSKKTSAEYINRYVQSLFYKGDVLAAEKHFLESFNWYYKAKEILSQKNDPCSMVEYSHRLAATSYKQEKYLEAANYYKQIIKDIQGCAQMAPLVAFKGIQGNMDNIGIAYVKAGRYDSAEIYFTGALSYIKQHEDLYKEEEDFMSMSKAVIYGNYADVAIHEHKTAMAEYLLTESIKINDIPSHAPLDAAISRAKLANLYLDNGKLKDAEAILQKITPEHYTHFNALTEQFYLLHAKISELKGDSKTAYQYLEKHHQFRDSVIKETGPVASADMQQTVNSISRQYQIDILEKDNKLKSSFLWLTAVIAVMAVIIIFLVLTNYRRSKKNVLSLIKLNDAITVKNQALLQTLSALEQSHSHNSKLLKVVAHDLRGPLGAITSIAELSRDGHVPAEKYTEIMGIIFKSGNKALALANDLLVDMQTVGRLNNMEMLNIADQLLYCVALYDQRLKEKNQTIILATQPLMVKGDREKLWRVFSNLIGNAIKFSYEGGEIKIGMVTRNELLIISFQDNGIGIPEELRDRIFEPTEATTRQGTLGEPSFGIGLSIARHIVLQHGGQLWFESNAVSGTIFYVSLPLVEGDSAITN